MGNGEWNPMEFEIGVDVISLELMLDRQLERELDEAEAAEDRE